MNVEAAADASTLQWSNRDVTEINSIKTLLLKTHACSKTPRSEQTWWQAQSNDSPNRKSAYVQNSGGNTLLEEDALSQRCSLCFFFSPPLLRWDEKSWGWRFYIFRPSHKVNSIDYSVKNQWMQKSCWHLRLSSEPNTWALILNKDSTPYTAHEISFSLTRTIGENGTRWYLTALNQPQRRRVTTLAESPGVQTI